jgi:hypothetical protein
MKRSIIFSVVTWCGALAPLPKQALAQPEPIAGSTWTAESSAGPAMSAGPMAAWKGGASNQVWYSVYTVCGGTGCTGPFGWLSQQKVTGAKTSAAPALSSVGPSTFLAFKGQSVPSDKIFYSIWGYSSGFPAATNQICDQSGNCAQTIAGPAAAAYGYNLPAGGGDAYALYVAWTTPADTIQLATYTATGGSPYGTVGTWTILPPVPLAQTNMAPALALFNNTLVLAWVAEGTTQVEYATMPLGGSWTAPAAVSGVGWKAESPVPPALAVFTVPSIKTGLPSTGGLYIAWTTPMVAQQNAIDVALGQLSGSAVEWNPPIPIPPGPLTVLTPALASYSVSGTASCDPTYYYLYLGYTALNGELYDYEIGSGSTPPVKGCLPE